MGFTTAQSGGALTLKMRRGEVIYGQVTRADLRNETEMKIVGAAQTTTSTAIIGTAVRMTIRNDTANVAIAVAIVPTVNAMMMMRYMSMTGEERVIGAVVGHGTGLDRVRHDQKLNTISVIIGHTAQPDPPHLQPQSATGTKAL